MKSFEHRPLKTVKLAWLAIIPLVVFGSYRAGWGLNPLLIAAVAGIVGYAVWSTSLRVRVDSDGVALRGRSLMQVPFTSIDRVALTMTEPPELQIHLRHGAPLPEGVTSAIHDPVTQTVTAGELNQPVGGIDPLALEAALERFGRMPLRRA